MPETLFTGIYPPSPPPRPQESYPEPELHQGSDAESLDSSISSIPPKSPKRPYSSRLKAEHLALSVLPEIIVPPSRETTPEQWKRATRAKNDLQAAMGRFRAEHRSAELGTAYLGDRTALLCTRFARCEFEGPRRKKRRTDTPPVKEVWDVGYGMGLPPLVDTDAEWEAWEKTFESRKAEVLAQMEAERAEREAKKRKRQITHKRTPTPQPSLQPAPVMGLGTRVEDWRNAVLPSSQPEPQLLAQVSESQVNVRKDPSPAPVKSSQSSQLSFKVVKKASSTDTNTKGDGPVQHSPTKRRELPPSVPVVDPLQDILVESSLPQPIVLPRVDEEDEEEENQEQSFELHANGHSGAAKETQETEESIRVIAAYAADNPEERLNLDVAPYVPSQDSESFSTVHSWSNSYREGGPENFDTHQRVPLPTNPQRNDLAPTHLAPYSEGSGEIDMQYDDVANAEFHPMRAPAAELRLSEIMHVDGDEVTTEKEAKKKSPPIAVVVDPEPPSFDQVVASTPAITVIAEEGHHHDQESDMDIVRESLAADSESREAGMPVEVPSFDGVPTSTQFYTPAQDKLPDEDYVPETQEDTPRKPSVERTEDTSVEEVSFRGVVHSTQTSQHVNQLFTRPVRVKSDEVVESSQDPAEELSFSRVITSTQAPPVATLGRAEEVQVSDQPAEAQVHNAPEILVPCSQTSRATPPSTPTPPSRKRKRSPDEVVMGSIHPAESPSSTPKPKLGTDIPSSTLTPPTTPSAQIANSSKGEAAREMYRTPTSAKRVTNLADLVRPMPGQSTSSPNRVNLADLDKPSPRGSPSTPTGNPTIRRLGTNGKQILITPLMADSPFSTPPSIIRSQPNPEESPPSMRKPNMALTAFGAASTLGPQSSGLFGMEYNSQFQIEENVEAVASFLKDDVWESVESP